MRSLLRARRLDRVTAGGPSEPIDDDVADLALRSGECHGLDAAGLARPETLPDRTAGRIAEHDQVEVRARARRELHRDRARHWHLELVVDLAAAVGAGTARVLRRYMVFAHDAIKLIEWPEKAAHLMPAKKWTVSIQTDETNDDARVITVSSPQIHDLAT